MVCLVGYWNSLCANPSHDVSIFSSCWNEDFGSPHFPKPKKWKSKPDTGCGDRTTNREMNSGLAHRALLALKVAHYYKEPILLCYLWLRHLSYLSDWQQLMARCQNSLALLKGQERPILTPPSHIHTQKTRQITAKSLSKYNQGCVWIGIGLLGTQREQDKVI